MSFGRGKSGQRRLIAQTGQARVDSPASEAFRNLDDWARATSLTLAPHESSRTNASPRSARSAMR